MKFFCNTSSSLPLHTFFDHDVNKFIGITFVTIYIIDNLKKLLNIFTTVLKYLAILMLKICIITLI